MKQFLILILVMSATLELNAQVPRKMIVEHFTNTLCPPCASINPGFYANLNNQSDVLHLSIHSSAPYSQCLLYQQNSAPSDGRRFYYNVNATPSLVINGFSIPTSNNYSQASLFVPFQGKTSPVSIRMEQAKYGNDSLKLRVIIKREGIQTLGAQQLWVGVAEDTVWYTGPNGEATHYDVFRSQLDLSTVTVPPIIGDSMMYEYTLYSNVNWDFSRIFGFAMLQNVSNKLVTQSESTQPTTNNFVTTSIRQLPELASVSMFPNPTQDVLTIELDSPSETTAELFNWSGQLLHVDSFHERTEMNLKEFPQGVYLLRLTNEGRRLSKKVVLE